MVWGFISALGACCGVALMHCWFVGLLVCWLVALLVFWFVGCLFVGCLAPESKDRGRVARRAVRYISAAGPWTLGPDSRQTDNQQTRKPAKQRANRPTKQQSNKPTKQQTNTTTNNESRNEPQTNQKTIKKSTKNQPKWLQNRSWRLSWAPLGASWRLLGPSWRQEGPKSRKPIENTTGGPPLEGQVETRNSLKIGPEAFQRVIIFLIGCGGRVLLPFELTDMRFDVRF